MPVFPTNPKRNERGRKKRWQHDVESAFHRAKNNALTSPVLRKNEMSTVFMEGFSRGEICSAKGRKAFNFTISFRYLFSEAEFSWRALPPRSVACNTKTKDEGRRAWKLKGKTWTWFSVVIELRVVTYVSRGKIEHSGRTKLITLVDMFRLNFEWIDLVSRAFRNTKWGFLPFLKNNQNSCIPSAFLSPWSFCS